MHGLLTSRASNGRSRTLRAPGFAPHGPVAVSVLLLAGLAVVASATHAPHLPELLLGLHGAAGMAERGVRSVVVEQADTSADELWCSVMALPPVTRQALPMLAAASTLLAAIRAARPVSSTRNRTKPPPLVGGRLRAALQVFLN